MTETDLHIACVQLLRLALPSKAVLHHTHNEGKRTRRDAGLAKAMGQRAGFADLMILHAGRAYFIELKTATGRQSPSQQQFEFDILQAGFPHYAIVRSVDELIGVLRAWDLCARSVGNAGPLRASAEMSGQVPDA